MPVNGDGTLRYYNSGEVSAWHLGTRGIRDGSHPEETYSPSGNGCSRKWLCDWGDRFDVIKMLVGEVLVYDDSGTKYITRTKPQLHPTFTNWACVRARVTGHKFIADENTGGNGANRIPQWDAAEIVADYEQVPFKMYDDADVTSEIERWVTEPGRPGAESQQVESYVTLPGGTQVYIVSGGAHPHGVPVPYSIGYTDVAERIFAIWHRVPEDYYKAGKPLFDRLVGDPIGGTRPWRGCVNSTPLFGRPKYTCLLETVEAKLIPDPIGSGYNWTIKYQFLYRPQTHIRLIYFDTSPTPVDIAYHLVGRDVSIGDDPDVWADGDAQFPARDFADGLFKIS